MKFKEVNCNLCGIQKHRKLTRCRIEKRDTDLPIGHMDIVRCVNCGLVYVNPQPEYSKEEYTSLYSKRYFDAPYMRFYVEKNAGQSNEPFSFRLDWIERFKKGGRILDIGCASGGFLRVAKTRGWDTFGVELSAHAADIAEGYGLDVRKGILSGIGFDSESFDVVTAGDVLEHTEDPKSFLTEINRIMKRGGLIYIGVPDFDGLYYRIFLFISIINHKNYFVLPHHLYFLNRHVISKYMDEMGFDILDIKKSESNILDKGFTGLIMKLIFFTARVFKMKDRILILAKKRK